MTDHQSRDEAELIRRFRHDAVAAIGQIKAFTQLLGKELGKDASERARLSEARIVEATDRLLEQVEALTELHRGFDSGSRARVSLEDAARGAVERAKRHFADVQAEVTIGALPRITASPSAVQRLFDELVDNAFKYREGDTVRLDISAEQTPDGDTVLRVRDDGAGFDARS